MTSLRTTAIALALVAALAAPALAGPTYTFTGTTSNDILNATNVGSVSLTQLTSTTVDVKVDLFDTTAPAPMFGFINTSNGNSHTPFTFTLAGTEAGLDISFLQPSGGSYFGGPSANQGPYHFSLSTMNSPNAPYGTFGIGITSTAGNGSGKAYYGDLEFTLTRATGLSTDDFIANTGSGAGPAYFAADLTNGSDTGAVAWKNRSCTANCGGPVTNTPEPASLSMLGAGLIGLAVARRRRK